MKNLLTNHKAKFLPILSIAVLALFALSPLASVAVAQTAPAPKSVDGITKASLNALHAQLPKMTAEQRVDALTPLAMAPGTPALSNLGHYSAAQVAKILGASPGFTNKPCSSGCIYIADEVGALQVTNNHKLVAEMYTGTSSDPDTCPTDAYFFSGVVYVADPCGNGYGGEIRTFNPTTWVQGTPITTAGYEAIFLVAGNDGNLYTGNFGYSTITVVSPSTGQEVTSYSACGYYPEFLDNQVSSNTVYVGDNYMGYFYDAGCMDAINTSTQSITHISITNADCGGCATANGVAVNQYNGLVYAIDPFIGFYGYGNLVYTVSGTSQTSTTLTLSSSAEEPWGAAYNPADWAVFVTIPYDTSSTQGWGGFQTISASNVVSSSIVDTGSSPNAACANSLARVGIPNLGSGNPSFITLVKGSHLKDISLSFLGYADPFGCGGS